MKNTKEEIQEQHPKEVAILLEIYKRSISHIEGYEKLTWATSFQISEVIEAMGIYTTHLTDQIKSMENYIRDVDGQVKELRELLREVVMRTNIAMPETEQDIKWFDEVINAEIDNNFIERIFKTLKLGKI